MNCTGDLLSALKEPTVYLRIQMKKEGLPALKQHMLRALAAGPEGLGGIALKFPKEGPLKPLLLLLLLLSRFNHVRLCATP